MGTSSRDQRGEKPAANSDTRPRRLKSIPRTFSASMHVTLRSVSLVADLGSSHPARINIKVVAHPFALLAYIQPTPDRPAAASMAQEHPQAPRNKAALATAKAIPVFLALVVAYASYVVVGPLSIDYLINAPEGVPRRVAAGIAIPIVWFFLLLPVAVSWLRLLLVVFRDAGYVPYGDDATGQEPPADFWMKDVFVCDPKGLPIWCQHCRNWKPDRAHHNQDCGRCTLKMDHFCPWVGGVVGERSMKFFLQFMTYSLVLSTYGMILLAYFVHKDRSNVQWDVALGLAGFFTFFTLGMAVNSIHQIFKNVTTIEAINAEGRRMLLAVLLPPELQQHAVDFPPRTYTPPSRSGDSERPLTSEIDDPSHSNYFSNEGRHWPLRRLSRSEYWRGTVTYPLTLPTDRPPLPAPAPRTFAILETPPGLNPWDLGTPMRNFTAVFGPKLHHWLLPIRHSPCCDHSSAVSFYPLGPQFEQFLEDAGLIQARHYEKESTVSRSGKKRRKRRLSQGWANGERPDGWISEKEARRMRNEERARRMREERESAVS